MAIKVSGTTVIDNDRNANAGIVTATSLDVPPQVITFSPTDGSSDVSLTSNIVITFNSNVEKGSGNITLRDGSASGTVIETIAVSSGSVSISGGTVTINPSDFPTGKDIYVVVDEGAFTSTLLGSGTDLINTYNFTTGPITTSSFSPSDGATGQSVSTNIVITFSENITKGSGNITLRAGNPSTGTVRQTIDVTSGAVSVSGTQATINPPSNLQYSEDTYVVVGAGCFRNSDGDVASGNAVINTYNFTTESDVPPLGQSYGGGYLICCSGGNLWVVAPSSTEVSRDWYSRNNAVSCANSNAACGDWFIPSCSQLKNPGYQCRTHWDTFGNSKWYWSNTQHSGVHSSYLACTQFFNPSTTHYMADNKQTINRVRAFRCVSY
jgi:methionine-rich copper-binding protein CopC